MRTARLLTRRVEVLSEGGAVKGRGAVHNRKWHHNTSPPLCGQTNRCKNITLRQTSFAGGNNSWIKNLVVNSLSFVWPILQHNPFFPIIFHDNSEIFFWRQIPHYCKQTFRDHGLLFNDRNNSEPHFTFPFKGFWFIFRILIFICPIE